MKTTFSKVFTTGICAVLFNLSAFSQEVIILEQVASPSDFTTIELVQMDKNLTTFAHLVNMAGMTEQLENAKEHTLFVPTNEAFEKMSIEDFSDLIHPDHKEKLIAFIERAYLPKKVMKEDFKDDEVIDAGFDKDINVSVEKTAGDMVSIGGGEIVKADIMASNGILDILDGVPYVESDMLGN